MSVLIFLAQWLLLPTGSSSLYPNSCSLCSPLGGDPPLEHQSSLWHRSPSGHGCLSILHTVMLNNQWPAYPKLPRPLAVWPAPCLASEKGQMLSSPNPVVLSWQALCLGSVVRGSVCLSQTKPALKNNGSCESRSSLHFSPTSVNMCTFFLSLPWALWPYTLKALPGPPRAFGPQSLPSSNRHHRSVHSPRANRVEDKTHRLGIKRALSSNPDPSIDQPGVLRQMISSPVVSVPHL